MTVAEVTATPMKANSGIVVSRPRLWPMAWSFWLLTKRVKSGMLSESVAQKPTIAVRPGRNRVKKKSKNERSARPCTSASDSARIAPRLPTFVMAQTSSATPARIRNGAASVSSHLMLSVPAHTK